MKKLTLKAAGVTDIGCKESNQDAFVYKVADVGEHYAGIFAVADGVGGLKKGELASALAISNINRWWQEQFKPHYHNQEYLVQSLTDVFKQTNKELLMLARMQGVRMATTLSVLVIHKGKLIIVHVGDSRIYRIRPGLRPGIVQMTEDHSCNITREINGRPVSKTVLTQCLGNKEEFRHYSRAGLIQKQELYLVCSDGIYKTLAASEIMGICRRYRKDLPQAGAALVEAAKSKGETDNLTAILVRIRP
jgi:serine/threonine protein phosphatase PrpC